MAKVKYATGIDYVQGSLAKPTVKDGHKCGTYLIGTHRSAPTQSEDCTRLYVRNEDAYDRTSVISQEEIAVRERFAAVRAAVKTRSTSLEHLTQDQADFLAQKDLANGKKTMNAYLWAVCGAEYDEAHKG